MHPFDLLHLQWEQFMKRAHLHLAFTSNSIRLEHIWFLYCIYLGSFWCIYIRLLVFPLLWSNAKCVVHCILNIINSTHTTFVFCLSFSISFFCVLALFSFVFFFVQILFRILIVALMIYLFLIIILWMQPANAINCAIGWNEIAVCYSDHVATIYI